MLSFALYAIIFLSFSSWLSASITLDIFGGWSLFSSLSFLFISPTVAVFLILCNR